MPMIDCPYCEYFIAVGYTDDPYGRGSLNRAMTASRKKMEAHIAQQHERARRVGQLLPEDRSDARSPWQGRPQPSQFSPGNEFPDDWDDLLVPYQGRNMGCCAEAAWKASPALTYINGIFPTWKRREEKGLVGREAGGWSDDPNDQEKGMYEEGMQVQWQHVFLPWFKHLIENCHILDLPDAQKLIQGEHKDPYWYTIQEIGENAKRLSNWIPFILNEAAEKGEC